MTEAIGERLVEDGKLTPEQLARVRELYREKGGSFGMLLVQLGFLGERELATLLAEVTGLPRATSEDYVSLVELPPDLSLAFLKQHLVIPLGEASGTKLVASADAPDPYLEQALSLAFGRPVAFRIGIISEIQSALTRLAAEDIGDGSRAGPDTEDPGEANRDIAHLRDMASEAPVIRGVNQLVARALDLRASDIHIEPFDQELVVRYRIDGVLRTVPIPGNLPPEAIVSRIKVLANLDIAERRLPQDGRIKMRAEGREVDLRVSTVPTLHGESVVMRLLDRRDVPLDLKALGFDSLTLQRFNRLLKRPHGIVLVTGPTGSGKTTTLYAALSQLNTPEKKILTVEDPVEYQLDGINQIPIRPSIDLTFANALRAILRQDPDVIMVGEMRDVETARIAVQAALTGHKVFSTLHTNDAASSITRLQDMQVEDYLITSTVDGILAQRLVRTLCHECREPVAAPDWLRNELEDETDNVDQTMYRARGCPACDHTGYRGRTSILELLVMQDPLRRAIVQAADADRLRAVARECGMTDMRHDGLRKVLSGVTTIEEVQRVVQSTGTGA